MQGAKSPGITLRRSLRRQSPGKHRVAPGHGSPNKCGLPRRLRNGAEGRGGLAGSTVEIATADGVADAYLTEPGALPPA